MIVVTSNGNTIIFNSDSKPLDASVIGEQVDIMIYAYDTNEMLLINDLPRYKINKLEIRNSDLNFTGNVDRYTLFGLFVYAARVSFYNCKFDLRTISELCDTFSYAPNLTELFFDNCFVDGRLLDDNEFRQFKSKVSQNKNLKKVTTESVEFVKRDE